MVYIEFELDLFDTEDTPFVLDLEQFTDEVNSKGLVWTEEFLRRVWYWMTNSHTYGTMRTWEPDIYYIQLDVGGISSYVDISLATENPDGGWSALAKELCNISTYADEVKWDNDGESRLRSFMSMVEEEGWASTKFGHADIRETMSSFLGWYGSKFEIVEQLIKEGHMDPIPNYVVHDERATADQAEDEGFFSTYNVGWGYGAWR